MIFLELLDNDRISTNLFFFKNRHEYEDGTCPPSPEKKIYAIFQIIIKQGLKKLWFLNRPVSEQTK
jgi:hypothetical protein